MRIIFVILQLLLVHLAAYSQKVELIKPKSVIRNYALHNVQISIRSL